MCEICELSANSIVLDPTCGSGSFLVQAMYKMLKETNESNIEKRKKIKTQQLFGIEKEEKAFGLATTNMLIHEDGQTNIIHANLFEQETWISEKNINVILMNPPFNGQKMPMRCPKVDSKGVDATKGLYFVYFVANAVNNGLLATILPLSCAIGNNKHIQEYKKKMLDKHTLLAVFSLPDEVFHPGASVNSCIMLFRLNAQHNPNNTETFFGFYKEDGFIKKKYLGRVEKNEWKNTKDYWVKLYKNKIETPGVSVKKSVTANDEWLAEAYMETDYSQLTENDFVKNIREYIAHKFKYSPY